MASSKYGLIHDKILPEDYIFGAGQVKQEVLQPDGDWSAYLPVKEYQRINEVETCNCSGFGTANALEILWKRMFGWERNFSDRFIGINAGTYPPGNSPQTVIQSIRHTGLVDEYLLPFSPEINSVDKYYSPKPLPDSLTKEGKYFLDIFEIKHEWISGSMLDKIDQMKEALKFSPLGVSVYAWQQDENGIYYKNSERDNHWVCCFGYKEKEYWLIYDTYDQDIKKVAWFTDFNMCKKYAIIPRITYKDMLKVKSLDGIKYLVVHHTGGSEADPNLPSQDLTAEQVNSYHKSKWNFKSELGFYGGYNVYIDKDGTLTQYRLVGEETAAQKGHNKDSISICLAGNFSSYEKPTFSQISTLKNIIRWTIEMRIILPMNIVPHRALGMTECYGNNLSNQWLKDLINQVLAEGNIKKSFINYIQAWIASLFRQLGKFFGRKQAGRACDK